MRAAEFAQTVMCLVPPKMNEKGALGLRFCHRVARDNDRRALVCSRGGRSRGRAAWVREAQQRRPVRAPHNRVRPIPGDNAGAMMRDCTREHRARRHAREMRRSRSAWRACGKRLERIIQYSRPQGCLLTPSQRIGQLSRFDGNRPHGRGATSQSANPVKTTQAPHKMYQSTWDFNEHALTETIPRAGAARGQNKPSQRKKQAPHKNLPLNKVL